jgi:membrane fusion protein (multidrug efflux system)
MLAGLWTLAACGHSSESAPAPAKPAGPPVPVVAGKVETRNVPVIADYVARTEGLQTVEIRARVAGVLEKVGFVAGGLVRKDQMLFLIAPDEYQAALQSAAAQLAKANADLTKAQDAVTVQRAEASVAQAKAQLSKSQRDVARLRPLAAAQAVPQVDLDTAITNEEVASSNLQSAEAGLSDTQLSQRVAIESSKAAVDSAKAAVKNAQLNLSYATIRSPLDGVAGFVKVDPGNYINPQSAPVLTTVSTIDPMKVTFGLSEADYLRVIKTYQWDAKEETPALTLTLADGTIYPYRGTPRHVDRALDPKTGTISVDATFPNPKGILRPGQFARVGFAIDTRKDAAVIPSRAVMKLQGIDVVYVVGPNNTVEQRTVTLGPRYHNDVVIEQGLKPGETIVIDGTQKVQPGGTVVPSAPATK